MYNQDNIFAKIISREVKGDIIYEDDKIIAIKDINPVAPIHVLVLPKGSYIDYEDFVANAQVAEIIHYFTKIADIAIILGLKKAGYRLVTNKGSFSGQSVFHFHTHIIGGKEMNDL